MLHAPAALTGGLCWALSACGVIGSPRSRSCSSSPVASSSQTPAHLTAARVMSYVPRTVFDNDEYRSRATTLAETADTARGLPASGPEGEH